MLPGPAGRQRERRHAEDQSAAPSGICRFVEPTLHAAREFLEILKAFGEETGHEFKVDVKISMDGRGAEAGGVVEARRSVTAPLSPRRSFP